MYERVSLILVTLMSHCDSHFFGSNTSFSENDLNGMDLTLTLNGCDCGVSKYKGKILKFLAV